MAHNDPSQTERTLTHIYVRDAQTGFVRPCWASGAQVYCGMCLRGRIEPSVGEACPICSSTVERILEVAPGGAAKPARKHKDHSVQTGRQHPEAGTAALLEPLSSQKARR